MYFYRDVAETISSRASLLQSLYLICDHHHHLDLGFYDEVGCLGFLLDLR